MSTYFDIIMVPLQVLIVFFTIYYFVISLFGILPRKKEKSHYLILPAVLEQKLLSIPYIIV